MRRAILLAASIFAAPASAQSPDISARHLLDGWKAPDQATHLLAEVIAASFAGGLSWRGALAGKPVYCPPPGLNGHDAMTALERFVAGHPDMAEKPYGDARRSVPLSDQMTGAWARAKLISFEDGIRENTRGMQLALCERGHCGFNLPGVATKRIGWIGPGARFRELCVRQTGFFQEF